jgi:hypothetical protein
VNHVDAGHHLEQLAGQVKPTPDAGPGLFNALYMRRIEAIASGPAMAMR